MQAGTVVGNLASVAGIRPDEAGIIAELQLGSEEAYAWLISTYHQHIYSLLLRSIGNAADASDLTQEVFLKVFRGIGNFHGDASLQTWIYRIAIHEASNQKRWWCRHQRQEVTMEREIGEENEGQALALKDTLIDEHDSPFELAAHEEIRARVELGLRDVPEPFRTVVILRDIEGFGYEEVAEILGINLGTVKSRLMRGRAHLKARLATYAAAAAKHPVRSQTEGIHFSSCTEEAR